MKLKNEKLNGVIKVNAQYSLINDEMNYIEYNTVQKMIKEGIITAAVEEIIKESQNAEDITSEREGDKNIFEFSFYAVEKDRMMELLEAEKRLENLKGPLWTKQI